MNSKRFFFVMLGIIGVMVILFAGGAYQSTKLLKAESDKLLDLKLQDAVLEKQQTDLTRAKRDIVEFSELEEITKSIVPQEKDQPAVITEIAQLAKQANIQLGSIEFPKSELGQATKKGKDAKAKSQAVDGTKTQLTELTDLKGVYSMNITINSLSTKPISYEQIINFLELLESNRRTAQVTNISITPSIDAPGRFTFTITLNTYIKP